jgi:hypothetical protein
VIARRWTWTSNGAGSPLRSIVSVTLVLAGPPDQIQCLVADHPGQFDAVGRQDHVAAPQPRLFGRRARDGRDDREAALRVLDPNPDPFVLAGKLLVERRLLDRLKKDGVVVLQRRRHPPCRAEVELPLKVIQGRNRRCRRRRHPRDRPSLELGLKRGLLFGIGGPVEILVLEQPSGLGKPGVGFRRVRRRVGCQAADLSRPIEQVAAREEDPLRDHAAAKTDHRQQRGERPEEESPPGAGGGVRRR